MSASPCERGPWVYFIQAGTDGPIKIGWTSGNPKIRLSKLQIGNPEKLRLLAAMPGSFEDEQTIHATFQGQRIRGEWFKPNDVLHGFIMGASWHASPLGKLPAAEAALDCGLTRGDLEEIAEFIDARRLAAAEEATAVERSRPDDLSSSRKSDLLLLGLEIETLARDGGDGVDAFGRDELAKLGEDLLADVRPLLGVPS